MKTPQNPPYVPPNPDKITLAAFMPNVNGMAVSDTLCSQLKDCGFNSALVEAREADVSSTLTNCAKYGIRPFLRSSQANLSSSKWSSFVDAYLNNPNLGGWFLQNAALPSQTGENSALHACVNAILEHDKSQTVNGEKVSHPIFMGVLDGRDITQYGSQSYKEYIENIEYTLNPTFWPVIPFRTQHYETFPASSFYRELEIFALMARYSNSPMWAFMQCLYNTEGEDFHPNLGLKLKSAAFSALAYGAQGTF